MSVDIAVTLRYEELAWRLRVACAQRITTESATEQHPQSVLLAAS